jgi:hypothetical protein
MYPSQRWRKYMINLWLSENKEHRLYYGRYLCRKWEQEHGEKDKLQTFQIHYMREDSLPNYAVAPVEDVIIWNHWCYDKPQEKKSVVVENK